MFLDAQYAQRARELTRIGVENNDTITLMDAIDAYTTAITLFDDPKYVIERCLLYIEVGLIEKAQDDFILAVRLAAMRLSLPPNKLSFTELNTVLKIHSARTLLSEG